MAGELEKEGSKAKKTKGSELPKKDSTTVKEWQKKVQEFLKKTRKLRSQANASAGSPTPTPLFAPDDNDTEQNADRMGINAATIEAARAALETAQKTMLSTQETARQMGDKALELQSNLAILRREIYELGQQRITLVSRPSRPIIGLMEPYTQPEGMLTWYHLLYRKSSAVS